MIPKRRKAPKANIRPEPQIRCPGHLQYVRGLVRTKNEAGQLVYAEIETPQPRDGTPA